MESLQVAQCTCTVHTYLWYPDYLQRATKTEPNEVQRSDRNLASPSIGYYLKTKEYLHNC